MIKDDRIKPHGLGVLGREPTGSLRLRFVIIFVVFLIIVMIYHTYFESPGLANEDDGDDSNLPKLHQTTSEVIFQQRNNTTRLQNPTIARDKGADYLVAFDEVCKNGSSTIKLIYSHDSKTWTPRDLPASTFTGANKPYLEFIQDHYFILSYKHNTTRYIQTSPNGRTWSPPTPSELFIENQSISYNKNYLLLTSKGGLRVFNYSDFEISMGNASGHLILEKAIGNASILKIHDYKFMIVHEDPGGIANSIVLTTVTFQPQKEAETVIKWDLLIIFIILGLFLLSLLVKEVARD